VYDITVNRRRLSSTVVALGVVSLLTDMSTEMIYPLMPVFLVSVLGATAVAIGVVEGIAESTAALLKVVSGRATDRSGKRKPWVVTGYGLSSLAKPLIGTAAAWPWVAGLRFADRIGKGLRTSPRDALIADVTDEADRGAAYGLHRAMDHAGAVAGPLIAAGLLLVAGIGVRQIFFLAAIPGIAVLLVLWRGVDERHHREPDEAEATHEDAPVGADLRRMLAAVAVFTLGNSTDAFILLRFSDIGVAAGWIAVLWAAHNVVRMISTWIGGRWSDRIGRKPLMIAGWALYAVVYLGFGAATKLTPLLVLFLVYGLYFGLTEPVERAWVAALAPAYKRGTAFGWYHGAIGFAALPASVLFGVIYTTLGPAAAFGTGAALAAIAVVILAAVHDPKPSAASATGSRRPGHQSGGRENASTSEPD
jgi:MFS family permease